jgi:hypothetical protein
MVRYTAKQLKAFRKKYFETPIYLNDLLKRDKIYPFHTTATWRNAYYKWIKKNREYFGRKHNTRIMKEVREYIIDTYNDIMISDMIYNHVIVEMPYANIYLFISQAKTTKRDRKLDFATNMYDVDLQVYYKKIIHEDAKYKFKTAKLTGTLREKLDKAIEDGHRYPGYKEVINFIEETTNV